MKYITKILLILIIFSFICPSALFAYSASSANYTILDAQILVSCGKASSANYSLNYVIVGNPFGGKAQSANYTLNTYPPRVRTAPNPPTLDPVTSPTNTPTQTLSGTKDAGTSICINSVEVIPLDNNTTWSYEKSLSEGENHLSITSENSYGLVSGSVYTNIVLDSIPPPAVAVTDEGDYTTDNTKLIASWSSVEDTGSGLREYKYAVGTIEGGSGVMDWASCGLATDVTIAGLNLVHDHTYYISVRAYDNADNYSEASSDGIEYDRPPEVVTFTISSEPSFHQNTEVTLDTSAADADNDAIEYKYMVGNSTIQDYSDQSSATWNPFVDYIKETTLKVYVSAFGVEVGPQEKQVYIFRAPVKAQ